MPGFGGVSRGSCGAKVCGITWDCGDLCAILLIVFGVEKGELDRGIGADLRLGLFGVDLSRYARLLGDSLSRFPAGWSAVCSAGDCLQRARARG